MEKTAQCLDCQNKIKIKPEQLQVGEFIECPLCGAELEIISLEPLQLELLEEEK